MIFEYRLRHSNSIFYKPDTSTGGRSSLTYVSLKFKQFTTGDESSTYFKSFEPLLMRTNEYMFFKLSTLAMFWSRSLRCRAQLVGTKTTFAFVLRRDLQRFGRKTVRLPPLFTNKEKENEIEFMLELFWDFKKKPFPNMKRL